jgi:hypothetical protein
MPHVKLDPRLQPFAAMLLGAVVGGLSVKAVMPTLRAIDPIGITPVVLIATAGVAVLWWYLRGRLGVHPGKGSTR